MSKFSDSGGTDDDSGLEPQFIRPAVQFPKALLYTLLSDGIRYYTYIERWNTSSTARTAGCCLYKYLYIGLYRHQCVCVYLCRCVYMWLGTYATLRVEVKGPYSSEYNCDMRAPAPLPNPLCYFPLYDFRGVIDTIYLLWWYTYTKTHPILGRLFSPTDSSVTYCLYIIW